MVYKNSEQSEWAKKKKDKKQGTMNKNKTEENVLNSGTHETTFHQINFWQTVHKTSDWMSKSDADLRPHPAPTQRLNATPTSERGRLPRTTLATHGGSEKQSGSDRREGGLFSTD